MRDEEFVTFFPCGGFQGNLEFWNVRLVFGALKGVREVHGPFLMTKNSIGVKFSIVHKITMNGSKLQSF